VIAFLKEYVTFIVIGLVMCVILGGISWALYHEYQHPCVEYTPTWINQWVTPAYTRHWTTYTTIHIGKTSISFPHHHSQDYPEVVHPAHWEQVCTRKGDRRKGDVPAEYAWPPCAGPPPCPVVLVER